MPAHSVKRPITPAGVRSPPWSFNLSHHGDYVVLVAHADRPVGVDVMDTAPPLPGTSVDAFLGQLRSQVPCVCVRAPPQGQYT